MPAIDGYSIVEVPADDVLWMVYGFPAALTLHPPWLSAPTARRVARLILASSAGERTAIDTFVERMYDEQINLPLDVTPTADGTAVVLNGAIPEWTELEGSAVMRAEQEIDGNFQWAWGADDRVWIVRGKRVAEDYVRAVLRVHGTSLDPYDTQGLIGDLWDHTVGSRYQYHDFPAPARWRTWLGRLPGVCSERFYLGAVFPDGVYGQSSDTNDLWLGLEKAGSRCVEQGLLDETAADIAFGRRAEQIGGLTVYRDEQITSALIGDVLITLFSTNPQTFVDMAPFIGQFLCRPVPVTHGRPHPERLADR